ncbi:hypothetical protein A5679_20850 [Mycobacterium scrofulaceum]|uniref:PPE family protein n=2 Tax=Mycobacterium scrofulaceum TaxID=1783 RepID=A0A1A2V8G6_MYCSC|nr:hypothetical protein A5679_20850 [Mycobacterium scrofulaceum]
MYAGPGSATLLSAAAAWNSLAAELSSVATSYQSVITGLISEWLGPSSAAMAAAAAPYMAWLSATAGQAELTGAEAQAAAGAFQTAFAMMVPPPLIAANRTQLMNLVATNLLGQNTPAIAATETEYGEMWAQDAAAMYGYAAASAVVTGKVTPFSTPPETTNPAGSAAQGASTASSTGNSTSTLSKLVSSLPQSLQNLASPGSSTGTSAVVNPLTSAGSGGVSTLNPITGTVSSGGGSFGAVGDSLLSSYLTIPGDFAMFMGADAIAPLLQTMTMGLTPAAMAPPLAADLPGMAAAGGALGGLMGPGLGGGMAGLGQAASVGALSVPANWGWAATAPPGLVGAAPLGMLAPAAVGEAGTDLAAGFPFPFGGLPRAAAMGAGVGAGAAAVKYGPRLKVAARSPAAGYAPTAATPPPAAAKYPVPTQFPTNGHAPPGYQPAIVYLPTNEEKTAKV